MAFPRSPMVTAATAWELAEASGGRFRLGLGAQVRAHIERRYGAEFDHPGPRLREYVLAVKQIFESFRTGAPLAVEGEFYNLSLLPPTWAPGAIDCADPPVDVAAVNPWMLRMAGGGGGRRPRAPAEHADLPARDRAAQPRGRRRRAPGARSRTSRSSSRPSWSSATPSGARLWRERARVQVAFYGSTPNYAFIFEQLDREGTTDQIRERQRAGDIPGMAAVIDDDLLENFVTEGTWDDIADKIVAKYGGDRDQGRQLLHRPTWADPDAFARGIADLTGSSGLGRRARPQAGRADRLLGDSGRRRARRSASSPASAARAHSASTGRRRSRRRSRRRRHRARCRRRHASVIAAPVVERGGRARRRSVVARGPSCGIESVVSRASTASMSAADRGQGRWSSGTCSGRSQSGDLRRARTRSVASGSVPGAPVPVPRGRAAHPWPSPLASSHRTSVGPAGVPRGWVARSMRAAAGAG